MSSRRRVASAGPTICISHPRVITSWADGTRTRCCRCWARTRQITRRKKNDMIASRRFLPAVWCGGLFPAATAFASNPLITDQFTADPTARVFNGKIYLYPSHDILAVPGKGRPGWFCMEDYHVFSSSNLTDWTDHGVIVSQTSVEWVKPASYSMWAPDCVCKNGKYYFYFPALAKEG